jgi:hypothetical protein
MKNTVTILILTLLLSCNNSTNKVDVSKADIKEESTSPNEAKPMNSGNYNSLLVNYSCNMTDSELAKVLDVKEGDVSISEYSEPSKCVFNLKGFGENVMEEVTLISWGLQKSSKARNKKEIQNYLKNQKELGENVRLGMSIELAETKDSYIAQQPAHSRVIIYNENYDTAFMLYYGRKGEFKRSDEDHKKLRLKMTDLANYLLNKHRK